MTARVSSSLRWNRSAAGVQMRTVQSTLDAPRPSRITARPPPLALDDALDRLSRGGQHLACAVDIGAVVHAHVHIRAALAVEADVLDRVGKERGVGHDEAAVVEGVDRGVEQFDLIDRAGHPCRVDHLPDLEGAKSEQHHAGGEVGERSLEGQADGKTGRGDDSRRARHADADELEHAQQRPTITA